MCMDTHPQTYIYTPPTQTHACTHTQTHTNTHTHMHAYTPDTPKYATTNYLMHIKLIQAFKEWQWVSSRNPDTKPDKKLAMQ